MEAAYRVLVGGEERFGFTDSVDVDQDTCTIPLIGEPDMQLALNRYTPITPLGHCCHDPLIADGFLAAALLHTGHRAWSHDEYQSVEAVELDPDGPIEGEFLVYDHEDDDQADERHGDLRGQRKG